MQKLLYNNWRTLYRLDQGFFRNPTADEETAIRTLGRKAKNLNRMDVFHHLRKITPPGTTGFLFDIIFFNLS